MSDDYATSIDKRTAPPRVQPYQPSEKPEAHLSDRAAVAPSIVAPRTTPKQVFDLREQPYRGAFDLPSGETGLVFGDQVLIVKYPRLLNPEQSKRLIDEQKRVLYAVSESLATLDGRQAPRTHPEYRPPAYEAPAASRTPRRSAGNIADPSIVEAPHSRDSENWGDTDD